MNHSQTSAVQSIAQVPVRRYGVRGGWEEPVAKSLVSPAPDGTVVYFQDTLSPLDGGGDFIDGSARAVCQYLYALAVGRGVEIADGPYLQVLEDDGAVPPGWQMLRALIWVTDYDVAVPATPSAADDTGLTGAGVV